MPSKKPTYGPTFSLTLSFQGVKQDDLHRAYRFLSEMPCAHRQMTTNQETGIAQINSDDLPF
jgi:hypothetical protein